MDMRLVAWGREVKARRGGTLPPLWLFTDPARTPDVVAAVANLPPGLCGVVFRYGRGPDGILERDALARHVARVCRARRLKLVVAGRPAGLPGAGRHLREGQGMCQGALRGWCSASAHGVPGLVRARRTGAAVVFLSPVFPTVSHPGARTLGVWRWAALARRAGVPVLALGGIDGVSVRRLPRWVAGVGAIGALSGRVMPVS